MTSAVFMSSLCLAFFLGLTLAYFYMRLLHRSRLSDVKQSTKNQYERELSLRDTDLAVLRERLSAKEQSVECFELKVSQLTQNLTLKNQEISQLKVSQSALEMRLNDEQQASAEKLKLLNEAKQGLADAFKGLSADALKSNNHMFLEIATTTFDKLKEGANQDLSKRQESIANIVQPVHDSLQKFDLKIQSLEKARIGAYEGLNQQVKSLLESQIQLRSETTNLVNALRTPQVRGRWGEMQLRRVVEMAGMLNHCDFKEQPVVKSEEGLLRPDLIVNLPGGKTLVVDAKVPLTAYLESIESDDDQIKNERLASHARRIRAHIAELSRKSYWEQFENTPEFVVLFLPGEAFFSAALQSDPALIEHSVDQRVIIATPTTLIALLKAVSYGWRQESLAENTRKIGALGKTLHKRIHDMSRHFGQLGGNLQKAVESYNKTLGSFESRVLVTARHFEELDISHQDKPIPELTPIDNLTRNLQTPISLRSANTDTE